MAPYKFKMENPEDRICNFASHFVIKSILNDYKESEHYIEGYVCTKDEVVDVLRHFSISTCTRYSVTKACRSFGNDLTSAELQNVRGTSSESSQNKESQSKTKGNFYGGKLRCLWTSQREPNIKFDGVPFIIRGSKVMQCKCVTGPFRNYGAKVKQENGKEPKVKRLKTEKMRPEVHSCLARLRIKEIFRFPEFSIEKDPKETSKHFERVSKRFKLDELRDACASDCKLPLVERRFYILLPKPHLHNHQTGTGGNKSLEAIIHQLQEDDPSANFFFQSSETVENSQENLAVKAIKHELNESEDSVKMDDISQDSCGVKQESYSGGSFLFVHQTHWQREFLMHYGNELSVLNPMIETQSYCLPLYFVYVKTDLGYTCVATFIVHKETVENLSSALKVLMQWNVDWKPKYWMTVLKHSGAEITALQENFPASKVYLCPLFVEEAIHRWITVGRYKVDVSEQEELESMILRIKNAEDEPALHEAQCSLEKSHAWLKNQHLQNWFCDLWVPHIEKWAYYYQKHDGYFKFVSSVNSHTPLAKMNIVYSLTTNNPERTMKGVISQVVESYLPSLHMRFVRNFQRHASTYSSCLVKRRMPAYLDGRPHQFFKHCMDMLAKAERKCEISKVADGSGAFMVTHRNDNTACLEMNTSKTWMVKLISEDGMPQCNCENWLKTRWPCQHFFELFVSGVASWLDLPHTYTSSPFLKVFPFTKSFQTGLADVVFNKHHKGVTPEQSGTKQKREKSFIKHITTDRGDFVQVYDGTSGMLVCVNAEDLDQASSDAGLSNEQEEEVLNLEGNVVIEVVIGDEVSFDDGYYDTGYISTGENSKRTNHVYIPLNTTAESGGSVVATVTDIHNQEDMLKVAQQDVSGYSEVQDIAFVQSQNTCITEDPPNTHNTITNGEMLQSCSYAGKIFLQVIDDVTGSCSSDESKTDKCPKKTGSAEVIVSVQPDSSMVLPADALDSHNYSINSEILQHRENSSKSFVQDCDSV
ncbi:uncharacterized protein LOC135497036 [Lineus longissimus]|uniref:uncharacterized protein LOC135497036 n=1 Tax=Lineus longissimus TaxID=88925 RepID=UPI00315D32E9